MDYGNIEEETLQELKGIITLAGNKIRDLIQKYIVVTLLSVMSHPEGKA
jgi:hypothetical protein